MEYSLGDLVDRIGIVNQKIWALENDLRKGKEGQIVNGVRLTKEEIGKRAIMIRDINRERVALKNAINAKFRKMFDYFKEYKINHCSEDTSEPGFGES